MPAAAVGRVGFEDHIPVDAGRCRLLVQRLEQQRIEVHALQRRRLSAWRAEAMQQFSLGPACDARVNGQHEQAALLQASLEPLFDRGSIGHLGVAVGPRAELGGVT